MKEYWKVVVDEKNEKMVAKVMVPENYSVHEQSNGIVDCLAYHVIGFYRKDTDRWTEDETTTIGFTFATTTKVVLTKGETIVIEPKHGYGMHAFNSLDNQYLNDYLTLEK